MTFGEIWREDLGQNLFRYCVVVSPKSICDHFEEISVISIVSKSKHWPTRVGVSFQGRLRQIQGELIRSTARSSLVQKMSELSLIEKAKLRLLLVEYFKN